MRRFRSGQTLLEGIIAIAVVTVGLMGVVGLAISNEATARATGDRAVAAALAREGLEVAKHVRDSSWLANEPFGAGLLDGGSAYAIPRASIGAAGADWYLQFDPAYENMTDEGTRVTWVEEEGRYAQRTAGGGTDTKFRRRLQMAALCKPSGAASFSYDVAGGTSCPSGETLVGARVLSYVQWPSGPGVRELTLELRLFDWR